MRTFFLALAIFFLGLNTAQAQENAIYQATITNLTNEQWLTPPALVVHHSSFKLFTLGEEASEGIKVLAKDGANQPLQLELSAVPAVFNFVSGTEVIQPRGDSVDIFFWGTQNIVLSVASMLGTTNDGFVAARGLSLDLQVGESYVAFLTAYDAGSEENNELCAFISGAPCNNHNVDTATNEGFVSVHPGLTFTGDLGPTLAFASIAAKITITRAQ